MPVTVGAGAATLLALLRGEPTAVADPARWQEVLQAARQHGVAPLLFARLRKAGLASTLPVDLLASLHGEYLRAAASGLRRSRVVGGVLERLRCAGISAIPLKGAYLARHVYANLALRPMCDLDLLVRESDLERAGEALAAAGYTPKEHERAAFAGGAHLTWARAAGGLPVELHWTLIPADQGVRIDVEGLWERAQPCDIDGVTVLALSPEDLVLHLCLHLAGHRFATGLRPLCDIAETARHFLPVLDWQGLGQRALGWGVGRCAHTALTLAADLLGAPVPDRVLAAIGAGGADPQKLELAEDAVLAAGRGGGEALPGSSRVVRLLLEGGAASRLVLLWRTLVPSRARMAVIYPVPADSWRVLAYYPVRWKELVQRHGPVVWGIVRGDSLMRGRAARQDRLNELGVWLFPDRVETRDSFWA